MNTVLVPVLAVSTLVFALLFGAALLAWLNERTKSRLLQANGATLAAQARNEAREQAQAIADQLVTRATETFQAQDRLTRQRLEDQLKPVADTLGKFQEHVAALEKVRAEDSGGLKAQIAALLDASVATQTEARKLSSALRRGAGVQGRWGEQALRNVLEAAGMNARYDFNEQVSVDTEEGRRRPDCTVRLPGGGVFVIDAKCLAERLPGGPGGGRRHGARSGDGAPRPEPEDPPHGALVQDLLGPAEGPDAGLRGHVRTRRRLSWPPRSTAYPT